MSHTIIRKQKVYTNGISVNLKLIKRLYIIWEKDREKLNYPEADGPVAINVEGLEHVVGVETGVCNSHEG